MPRMRIELNWGPQYGGNIRGVVLSKVGPSDGQPLVQMHGQLQKSTFENAWLVEFADGDTCAVDLRSTWVGHRDEPGVWRPLTYDDL